jgi:hypothetical protein
LYTNEAREIAPVLIWFPSVSPLSGIVCFSCARSNKLSASKSISFSIRFSFWKSKINDVKNCFFQCFFAIDALARCLEAVGSFSHLHNS